MIQDMGRQREIAGNLGQNSVGYVQYAGVYEWFGKYYNYKSPYVPDLNAIRAMGGEEAPMWHWIETLGNKVVSEDAFRICQDNVYQLSNDEILEINEENLRQLVRRARGKIQDLFISTVVGALNEDPIARAYAMKHRKIDKQSQEWFARTAMSEACQRFPDSRVEGCIRHLCKERAEQIREPQSPCEKVKALFDVS